MNITADAVKQLRERTGAGMMECKKALVETKGDLDAAADLMRKQGLAKADKKAARVAAEGVIVIEKAPDGRSGAMVEVNCETDFVAREADFRAFAQAVAAKAAAERPASLDALLAAKLAGGESVDERRRALIAKIGENMSVRRFSLLSAPTHLGAYVHGTRIGALVAIEGGDAALAYDLAMHVAASNPRYVSVEAVPADVVAKERGILTEQAQNEARTSGKAKPADIVARMVEGRLRKSLGEITLGGQAFVKDPDTTVEKLLQAGKARVTAFERYEVGAGIEKKQEDFVAEVRKQIEGSSRDAKENGGIDNGGGGTVRH
jgi:elongation factor Ts